MNSNLYVENSNGASRMAKKEVYEEVQSYLSFYRETKGFKEYLNLDRDKVLRKAREKWQSVMNAVNANALYLGQSLYRKYLIYVNKLKELLDNPEQGHYPIIREWKANYPELAEKYEKAEKMENNSEGDVLFMDLFNELRIAANKEFLNKLIL